LQATTNHASVLDTASEQICAPWVYQGETVPEDAVGTQSKSIKTVFNESNANHLEADDSGRVRRGNAGDMPSRTRYASINNPPFVESGAEYQYWLGLDFWTPPTNVFDWRGSPMLFGTRFAHRTVDSALLRDASDCVVWRRMRKRSTNAHCTAFAA